MLPRASRVTVGLCHPVPVNTEADGNRDNTGWRVIERRCAFATLVNLKVAANYVDTHYLVKQPGSMVSRVYSGVQQYSLVYDFV